MEKPKLLLHACCAPCSGFLARELSRDFSVSMYFNNPNIFPLKEWEARKQEANIFFEKEKIDFIEEEHDHGSWLDLIKGLEQEPERGRRCVLCYNFRLEQTARHARENGFAYFTTTLSISPHKDARAINYLGKALSKKYKVKFLEGDFKKKDGFKKAMAFSHNHDFYRQHYCGCEFSIAKDG